MLRRFCTLGLALILAVVGTGAVVLHARASEVRSADARNAAMATKPTPSPSPEPAAAPSPEPADPTETLVVPAGKLAVSVELKPAGQVGGQLRAGSEVAVFSTTAIDGARTTRLLLVRVPVIGFDAGDQGKPGVATFALTQADAERLIHVANGGTLHLALLNATSALRVGPGVDDESLFRAQPGEG